MLRALMNVFPPDEESDSEPGTPSDLEMEDIVLPKEQVTIAPGTRRVNPRFWEMERMKRIYQVLREDVEGATGKSLSHTDDQKQIAYGSLGFRTAYGSAEISSWTCKDSGDGRSGRTTGNTL